MTSLPLAKHFCTDDHAISAIKKQNFSHTVELTIDCKSSTLVTETGCLRNPPWEVNFEAFKILEEFPTVDVEKYPSFNNLHSTKKKWCNIWKFLRTESNWTWKMVGQHGIRIWSKNYIKAMVKRKQVARSWDDITKLPRKKREKFGGQIKERKEKNY